MITWGVRGGGGGGGEEGGKEGRKKGGGRGRYGKLNKHNYTSYLHVCFALLPFPNSPIPLCHMHTHILWWLQFSVDCQTVWNGDTIHPAESWQHLQVVLS